MSIKYVLCISYSFISSLSKWYLVNTIDKVSHYNLEAGTDYSDKDDQSIENGNLPFIEYEMM